jgi:Tn3 transposase DDE domain/Domain of unknown function (DUF4158)
VAWAREHTRSGEHLLSLVCFGQLGYFPRPGEVPVAVVEYVRRELGLPQGTAAWCEARNVKAQRQLVRGRLGVVHDPQRARAVAEAGIRSAAEVMNHPPDLINVALELLVKASLELPAFSTVDELASRVRRGVNTGMFERVAGRIALPDRVGLENLLDVVGPGLTSPYNRLKQPAGKASWSGFREQVDHLRWVDSLGDTRAWLEGIAESKIADFAGEAMAADAAVMRDVAPLKRTALLACMVHFARTRARDDLAEMFCKRMASVTKLAKAELAELREREAEISERLIISYRSVLGCLDPRSTETAEAADAADAAAALRRARRIVEDAGGFDAQLAEIEAVSAHHANNYMPLVAKHRRRDRATMFAFTRVVELEATSADRSVLDAVEHAVAHTHLTRDFIPDHRDGVRVDLSFASEQWQRIVVDRGHPGQVHRRHFEACVFTYLASELRTGDIAVRGSQAYANWAEQLLPWSDCEELLDEFCAETGLPNTARAFTDQRRTRLADQAGAVDAKYPENTDLVIDQATGKPSLKRRRAKDPNTGALALEEALKERMPERTLLEILARTAYWLEWWRRFGPASGSDPKLAAPLLRYVLTTFTYGANLGPAQAARHIRGASAHELSVTAARHFTTGKLNLASADVVNAYLLLDLVKAWGDGTSVAADGTQVDTLIDNLLAESHIRYGGYGGIAYHHIADNYIALFSHFIPCGVWEAVYIIEGLLRQQSDAEPDTIHADTHGQSYPVHALAHLFGFQLLTRIRKLEGPHVLPRLSGRQLRAYRPAVRRTWGEHDQLGTDRDALGRPDAGRPLDPARSPVLNAAAAPVGDGVAEEQHLQGVPGARAGDPHDHAAAVYLRARAARGDHGRDEQGRVLQRVLRLAAVRARHD